MAVLDRVPLQRSVALIREDSISVRPSRGQIVAPLLQAALAGGAVWLMVTFFDSLPMWVLVTLLLVALVFGPVAVLGLVYNVYGNAFLIERHKQSARWQQGFLGLGVGTAELCPFWRIARIEVRSDADEDLASGQQQDLVQFEVRIVKDNGRVLDVGAVAVPRAFAEQGLERANRLAGHIAKMTEREFTPLALHTRGEAVALEAAVRPARRRSRRRASRPPRQA